MFILADKKNKGVLNESEILMLLKQLNVTAPPRVVKQRFKVWMDEKTLILKPYICLVF